MPQLLGALQARSVDAGVISPPTNLRALKLGLKELVDFGDLEIAYPNSPLATTQAYLLKNREVALRLLRAYCEGIRKVMTDREATLKIFAEHTKVHDPEILAELYRIYGVKHLEKIPYVLPEAVDEVLRSEVKTGVSKPADFIDNTLLAELEHNGFFRQLYREGAK
jgi:ABC-type nitrate/sulfonate/bicarbonate transport system substrate-binding protein